MGTAAMESLGQLLKHTRESKNISLEDVSRSTKMSLKVLNALEADEISKLPSGVYARVFVKTYGAFLGVGTQAMEQFEQAHHPLNPEMSVVKPQTPLTVAVSTGRPGNMKKRWILAVVLGIGLVILSGWIFRNKSHPPVSVEKIAGKAGEIAKGETSGSVPVAVPPPAAISGDNVAQEIPREGLGLEILAVDKVWLRVKADNLLLFEGTIAKGERESWRAQREFLIRIGSAGSVNVLLNDRDLGIIGKKGEVKTVVINKEGIVKTR